MAGRSQDPSFESSGRVNQKRRTRAAIIAAGRTILERGETPTVAQVAEEAQMTRTTVYRYFPSQEALLVELSISLGISGTFDELFSRPLDGTTPQDRMVEVVEELNRFVATNEKLFRTAQRHYLDTWLAAERAGDGHEQPLREGRRFEWTSGILEPYADTMSEADMRRLVHALCLVMGGEAYTVLLDVCRLDPEEAIAVTTWAARALMAAVLED